MRYYVITGEASGDLHASSLIKELKYRDASASFRCWGGERIKEQGGELVKHYRETAYMGFTDVILHSGKIWKLIKFCKRDILFWNPDVVILVDYPGFNLRIARFAHKRDFRVIYYISPQVWAWKSSRIRKIKLYVDRMYVILPFEKDFYSRHDYHVEYVGHPLLDAIEQTGAEDIASFRSLYAPDSRPIIAILPGSRKQEIRRILPIMLSVVRRFTDYQFVVAGLSTLSPAFYHRIIASHPVKIVYDQTYVLLKSASAALVTSGTATLETALLGVPQIICYRGEILSYLIARKLVKVQYIGLVNLIMEKEIVKELIQSNLNTDNLVSELHQILEGGKRRSQILMDYQEMKLKLGGKGASAGVADLISRYLQEIS